MYKNSVLSLSALIAVSLFACKKDINDVKALSAPPQSIEGTWKFVSEQHEFITIGRWTDKGDVDSFYSTAGYLSEYAGGELVIEPSRFWSDSTFFYIDTLMVQRDYHNGVLINTSENPRRGRAIEFNVQSPYTLIGTDSVNFSVGVPSMMDTIKGFHISWSGDTLVMFHDKFEVYDNSGNGETFHMTDYQSLKRKYVRK